jgi:hypothetical protein
MFVNMHGKTTINTNMFMIKLIFFFLSNVYRIRLNLRLTFSYRFLLA